MYSKGRDMEANGYRLPTDAEWEYAARGGAESKGYKYAGSNTASEVAWYSVGSTHGVGNKQPNELGLYDMSGNVRELCWNGEVRGGSWSFSEEYCMVSSRNQASYVFTIDLGFRVARNK